MPDLILRVKNWCRRFRHRCGYGVHSPSDFFFITSVVYEKLPFYAYQTLHQLRVGKSLPSTYREKVDKLYFRLVNYLQPKVWVEEAGGADLTTRYIEAACPNMRRLSVDEALRTGVSVDMVRLDDANYRENYERLLSLVHSRTCFIIGRPYATKEKIKWWKEVVADARTGVTFDLYDIGLVFFDKQRFKEHRVVNFF